MAPGKFLNMNCLSSVENIRCYKMQYWRHRAGMKRSMCLPQELVLDEDGMRPGHWLGSVL